MTTTPDTTREQQLAELHDTTTRPDTTALDRLQDAIEGERAFRHEVTVRPADLSMVLEYVAASLFAAARRDPEPVHLPHCNDRCTHYLIGDGSVRSQEAVYSDDSVVVTDPSPVEAAIRGTAQEGPLTVDALADAIYTTMDTRDYDGVYLNAEEAARRILARLRATEGTE